MKLNKSLNIKCNVSNAFRIKNFKRSVYVNVCYLMPLFISYTSCDVRKYKQMVINSESKHNSYSTYCLRREKNKYLFSVHLHSDRSIKYYTSGL